MWTLRTLVTIGTTVPFTDATQGDIPQTEVFNLDLVQELSVDNSLDTMTDNARIVLPKKASYFVRGKDLTQLIAGTKNGTVFQRGLPVTISVGYDYNRKSNSGKIPPVMNQIFSGYISDVVPNQSIEIACEDQMYKLKQCINSGFAVDTARNITLKDILLGANQNNPTLFNGAPLVQVGLLPKWAQPPETNISNMTFGGYRSIKGASIAWWLERMKSTGGLTFNFNNGKFTGGTRYLKGSVAAGVNVVELKYERDIISDDDMVYRRPDDMILSVKAVSTNGKNKVHTVLIQNDANGNITTYVDQNVPINITGQQINLKFYGFDVPSLTLVAQEVFNKTMFAGFTGKITTFLLPKVNAGDAVKLIHDRVPEKNGIYLVKRVVTSVSVNGGRQDIYLDRAIT